MYIEVNNYKFEIRINSKDTPIYIDTQKDEIYVLFIPLNFKENELLPYLKTNAKKLINKYNKNIKENTEVNISIYEKVFRYKWNPSILSSYKAEPYIYSQLPAKNKYDVKKIGKEVLLADIKGLLSEWEERFDCIIENIYLKNLKTKSFKICRKQKAIDYSSQLVKRHFDYVKFIVAKSVFEYLDIDELQQEKLMTEFINDWRQSIRIYNYEREYRN